ncbi:MAG: protein kinase, partial [Burkholderiales bacterium]|nr:protein kinase [Burkholderiales bacterium]
MGRVYKVLDTQFDVLAALKILHPEFSRDRAIKNTTINVFRSLSEFEADHFVKIYDAGEDQDKVFIATDYLEGLSLKRLMEVRAGTGSKFGWDEAEPIIDAVCSAIESMNPGEVHGDIKPENIIILPDTVKLTDLGLSRIAAPETFVTAQVVGGSGYLAPELATHADRLRTDPAIDVYSVGAVLYQLLTGSLPTAEAISPIKLVPDVPPAISKIVEKALQAHPDRRFNHVAEMHLDIARFTGKVETLARVEIYLHDLAPRTPFEEIKEVVEEEKPKAPAEKPAKKQTQAAAPAAPVAPGSPSESAPAATPTKSKSLFDDELMGDGKESKKETPPPPPPAAPSKAPMFAVIGAVVVAVAAGGLYFATRGAESPAVATSKPEPVAQPKVAAKTQAPETEKAGAPTKVNAQDALVRAEKSRDDAISVNAAKGAPEQFVTAMKLLREANDAMRASSYAQSVSLSVSAEQAFSDAIIKGVSGAQGKTGDKDKPKKGGDEPAKQGDTSAKQGVAAPVPVAEKKERCPEGSVFIKGGSFVMGAPSDDPDRNPGEKYNETLQVPGFCIDKYEFPNQKGTKPLAGVNWAKAKQQCEAVSKR